MSLVTLEALNRTESKNDRSEPQMHSQKKNIHNFQSLFLKNQASEYE